MSADDFDVSDRWNGIGTHHDRFLTNSEMLFIGVGLYRTAMWVKENARRLTPQEKAQYEIEVDRWKAYLVWEETTPGAREAREHLLALQEDQEMSLEEARAAAYRTRWVWRPLSLLGALMGASGLSIAEHGLNDVQNYGEPFAPVLAEWVIGLAAWSMTWRVGRRLTRSWVKARQHRLLREAYEREHPEPSRYLPVLWKAQP